MIKLVKSCDFNLDDFIKEAEPDAKLTETVKDIIDNIRENGDKALSKYTLKYDKCKMSCFEIKSDEIDKAYESVDTGFIEVMKRAAESIEDYHKNQLCTGFDLLPKNGVILGQKVTPVARAGCYVPGGTASYPSSVLMNCIPAKLAGVGEIILVTPPPADPKILAAAKIAGADRVFSIGGAQAIAALAFGTESVPRADKITGPGNAYVAEAKRQLYGIVGIDMLAGPSDVLVIAGKKSNPVIAAADMLSQCEHGEDSRAVLLTDSAGFAKKVRDEIKAQLKELPRMKIAAKAIDSNSIIVVTKNLDESFEISNRLAPEHLIVLLEEPFNYLNKVINAGSVFLGEYTPETFGDYLAGPNHILPTGGTARFSDPLTVDAFCKKTSYTYFSKEAFDARRDDAIRFAKEESLDAHARAVEKRLTNE